MQKILFLSLMLASLGLPAQDFDSLIEQAQEAYQAEKYEASARAYTQALEQKTGSALQYYNAACSWALVGDTDQALTYLQQSAEQGWINLSHLQRDADLEDLRATEAWQEILVQVESNLEAYNQRFNQPLKKQLEAIYVRDQTLRQLYREAEEKFGRGSEEMDYFWSVVAREDSLNEEEVTAILEEHGWVGRSEVGGRANAALWLVIQHAPLEMQEKYLPLLQASVAKGESNGNHLALLEDRILMRNGQPQKYGSQVRTNPETGEQEVHEIMNPAYVNQRRAEVGLGPIQDYLARWDIEWTVEQKER